MNRKKKEYEHGEEGRELLTSIPLINKWWRRELTMPVSGCQAGKHVVKKYTNKLVNNEKPWSDRDRGRTQMERGGKNGNWTTRKNEERSRQTSEETEELMNMIRWNQVVDKEQRRAPLKKGPHLPWEHFNETTQLRLIQSQIKSHHSYDLSHTQNWTDMPGGVQALCFS